MAPRLGRSPQRCIFITAHFLQDSPNLRLSSFPLLPPDRLTGNGLQCFPRPVNRLPAREGIDGFDIGCCLTQKRRPGPRDGPFLTLHIHHVGQSNQRDAGLPWGGRGAGGERGARKEEGVRFHPCRWAEASTDPPTACSHFRHSVFLKPLLSGSIKSHPLKSTEKIHWGGVQGKHWGNLLFRLETQGPDWCGEESSAFTSSF